MIGMIASIIRPLPAMWSRKIHQMVVLNFWTTTASSGWQSERVSSHTRVLFALKLFNCFSTETLPSFRACARQMSVPGAATLHAPMSDRCMRASWKQTSSDVMEMMIVARYRQERWGLQRQVLEWQVRFFSRHLDFSNSDLADTSLDDFVDSDFRGARSIWGVSGWLVWRSSDSTSSIDTVFLYIIQCQHFLESQNRNKFVWEPVMLNVKETKWKHIGVTTEIQVLCDHIFFLKTNRSMGRGLIRWYTKCTFLILSNKK